MANYRKLTLVERQRLESQGCRAGDWSKVDFAGPVDLTRVWGVCFLGEVKVGLLQGAVSGAAIEEPCGIYGSTLGNVVVGDGCLVKDVGHLSGYEMGKGVVIERVGRMVVEPGSTFGCGSAVSALNEGGGREVVLYPELSAQVAHLMALHRYRPKLIQKLQEMTARRAAEAKSDRGVIGAGAVLRGIGTIRNVQVGAGARVEGASVLENGTVLSEPGAPAKIGSGVVLREFVVAEGSSVTDGAILEHCYVGQGCKVGKGFSGENCLLFANCEAFHGEACSVFAGPYSVTHHKSTLLIGVQVSFYNAGSGTNQSNHMYKLGPVHQGILERGCKTGSFSYLLWPCRLAPFSVVIGKNMANFDLGDLPFSYVSEDKGKSYVIPAFNLFTVGTVRDGEKWPKRDRRKTSVLRDRIHFAVFSPFVVGRMILAEQRLTKLAEETDRQVDEINYRGAMVKRVLLKTSAKWYRTGIEAYLAEKLVSRAEPALSAGLSAVRSRLAPDPAGSDDRTWADLSGMLVAQDRLLQLEADIESGKVPDLKVLENRLGEIHASYARDEWNWVAAVWEERFGKKPADLDPAGLCEAADMLLSTRSRFLKTILGDADKEFSEFARIGFGADGDAAARDADFEAVRGKPDTNSFVVQIRNEIEALTHRVERFKKEASGLA